jgi:hypothetical protein
LLLAIPYLIWQIRRFGAHPVKRENSTDPIIEAQESFFWVAMPQK